MTIWSHRFPSLECADNEDDTQPTKNRSVLILMAILPFLLQGSNFRFEVGHLGTASVSFLAARRL
jgi:hypothetical protein